MKNSNIISKQFDLVVDLSHTSIYLHNNKQIILTIYKENAKVDVKESIEVIEKMKPIYSKTKHMYGIVYAAPGSIVTENAREYWAKNNFIQNNTNALAIVYEQLAQRLIISMFIKFNKPKTPLKVFKSIDSALNWINKY